MRRREFISRYVNKNGERFVRETEARVFISRIEAPVCAFFIASFPPNRDGPSYVSLQSTPLKCRSTIFPKTRKDFGPRPAALIKPGE